GSDYEEDARAEQVRRGQIPLKWRKPTIEEQDALDEQEFEQEVEQSLQTSSQGDDGNPGDEDDNDNDEDEDEDDEEDDDDEDDDEDDEDTATHKAGPIPLEAKERAFECYKTFMHAMEAIAKETGKPVSSFLKLVGLGAPKVPRGNTRWTAFQAYQGVYGDEKKPDDDWTKVIAAKYKDTSEEEKDAILAWHKTQYQTSIT
ncbi:hypothetical protein H0H92_015197, partial [Tricholoma furcatifolium]